MDVGTGLAVGLTILGLFLSILGLAWKFGGAQKANTELDKTRRDEIWRAIRRLEALAEKQDARIGIMEDILIQLRSLCPNCPTTPRTETHHGT